MKVKELCHKLLEGTSHLKRLNTLIDVSRYIFEF